MGKKWIKKALGLKDDLQELGNALFYLKNAGICCAVNSGTLPVLTLPPPRPRFTPRQESLFCHSLAASPRAGQLVSLGFESHPYNGDHDLSHRNVVRTNQRGQHPVRTRGVRS